MSRYDLDALGWLLFEQVATGALQRSHQIAPGAWSGTADGLRLAPGFAMAWVAPEQREVRLAAVRRRTRGRKLVTNAPEAKLGAEWLGELLDAEPRLRVAHPQVLGVTDVTRLVTAPSTSFDLAAAGELARVFAPTRAYGRALEALQRHGFVVLTGPPEMGKTATARVLALGLATDGWEVHETTDPVQVLDAWADDRSQVFIADDAFGSTEYRPDTAERWATSIGRLLRRLDDRHRLIWTSRPTPLRAALQRIHRGGEPASFPQPAEILVDAGDLDRAEKALILLRHGKVAAQAAGERQVAGILRLHGSALVDNPHFTPERIRRLVSRRFLREDGLPSDAEMRRALDEPTVAMVASLRALDGEHRDVLTAILDVPAGPIGERELSAALRRHGSGHLDRPPRELVDQLADHFLRIA